VIVLQTGWEQVLENNKQAFSLAFVAAFPDFTMAYPNSLTPAQFVDALKQQGRQRFVSRRTHERDCLSSVAPATATT
jgi:hypothetical protein